MKIISKDKDVIIVEMSEDEAMKISGVDGKPIISGRFKRGREISISPVYKKVAEINTKEKELKKAMADIRSAADAIENSLNLEG